MAKFITQLRHGTTQEWNESTVIPAKNELVVEHLEDGTYKFKLGNGIHTFSELKYTDSSLSKQIAEVNNRIDLGIPGYDTEISADGLSELQDIRNYYDGETVHVSAGAAVRAVGTEVDNLRHALQQFMNAEAVDGLEYENNMLYLTADGVRVSDPVEIKGGSGGGGEGFGYTVRLKNNMIATSFTAASSAPTVLSATFEELYGRDSTGISGTLTVEYSHNKRDWATHSQKIVEQNTPFTVDVTDILQLDTVMYVKVTVTGGESGIPKSLTYSITLVDARISAINFNTAAVFSGNVSFSYRCTGRDLSKTVHFVIDGVESQVDIGTSHNKVENYVLDIHGRLAYGAHDLRVFFTTPEGARSNELRYTLLYDDKSSSDPMVGVISAVDELVYGDTLAINYVVYTPSKETTDELIVTAYSFNGGEKVVHSVNTLVNIPNNVLQTWQGSNYPVSGAVYVEFKSGSTIKTVTVTVKEIQSDFDLTPVEAGLVYQYCAAGRSNKDIDRELYTCEYTTADNVKTNIEATFENFNWVSNGYLDNTSLTVSGDAQHIIKLPMFSTSYYDRENQIIKLDSADGATVTTNGRTFEIEFSVNNVTDIKAPIIKCMSSDHAGFIVTPQNCYLLASNGKDVELDSTGFIENETDIAVAYIKDNTRIRLAFVIEPQGTVSYELADGTKMSGQCINIYINGEFANSVPYDSNNRFAQSEYITIGNDSCITNVYDVRIYNRGLNTEEILQNYKASPISAQDKIARFEDNDILNDDGEVNYNEAIKKYPCLLITGPLAEYKDAPGIRESEKTESGVTLTMPDGNGGYVTEFDLLEKDADGIWLSMNNVQGTSSVKFPVKNYKIYLRKAEITEAGAIKSKKVTYSLKGKDAEGKDLSIGESTLCWKGDYMSSDHANTFNANLADTLFDDILDSQDPSKGGDARVQNTIYGFRCLLFRRDDVGSTIYFEGDGALNNDKGNTKTFGLECDGDEGNDTLRQKWEFRNNTEALTTFETDNFMELVNNQKRVVGALESTYPDQGDLEEEGLTPKYDNLQILYTWVYQRANFWDASDEELATPKIYKGTSYKTEKEYKKAIFITEFEQHFNMNHALVYYLFCEFVALTDNRAKNLFLRCEDIRCEKIRKTDGGEVASLYEDADIFDAETGNITADAIDWENSTFSIWITDLYDLDSCFGVENSGYLQVPYYAEWSYELKSDKKFNGYDSRLWLMFEAAFPSQIQKKAQELTNKQTGMGLNYETLYQYHIQDNALLVCPTVVNKDMEHKYTKPWTEGYVDYSQVGNPFVHNSNYKYLQRGSRTAQKDAFINRRCNMLYSKYLCSKFLNNNINFRAGTNVLAPDSGVTLKANQAIYPAVKFGDGDGAVIISADKIMGGEDSTTIYKPGSATESVGYSDTVYIAGGTLLTDIGDISKFHPYELQLQRATGLKKLTIGSTAAGYSNTMLNGLDTSNCRILEELNIANCSALSGTINLSHNGLLRKVVATGCGASSIKLPDGGVLEELHLGAVTDLEVLNQSGLTTFECSSYENLTTLRVENTPFINAIPILMQRSSYLKGIRLVGIDEAVDKDTLELLTTLQGTYMDSKGVVYDGASFPAYAETYPHITGTLHYDGELEPSLYSQLKRAYPELNITYGSMYSTLTFLDRDGTVIDTQEIVSTGGIGGNGSCPIRDGGVTYSPKSDIEDINIVWIRQGSGLGHPTNGYFKLGDSVTILEQKTVVSTVWGRTDRGWVRMEYVTLSPDSNSGVITTKEETISFFNHQQFTYSWEGGWTTNFFDPRSVDPDALKAVTEDRVVYPAFNSQVKSYNVRFWNDSQLLDTIVTEYNTTAVYGDKDHDGITDDDMIPKKLNTADSDIFEFRGWYPEPVAVKHDMDCYAQYYVDEGDYYTLQPIDIEYDLDGTNLKITKYQTNVEKGVVSIPETFNIGGTSYTTTEVGGFEASFINLVDIPDTVTSISNQAFNNCDRLISIEIGENVEKIGKLAFANCDNIQSIEYRATEAVVTETGHTLSPFESSNSTNGAVITIGNNVGSIPSSLFRQSSISDKERLINDLVWEEDSVCQSIGSYAFARANLSNISLPNSIVTIGPHAFEGNKDVGNVELPSSVKEIKDYAFQSCSKLEYMSIPGEVTSIGSGVLAETGNLDTIEIVDPSVNSRYVVIDGCLIDSTQKRLLRGTNNAAIPEGLVTSFDSYAFSGLNKLTELAIPEGVAEVSSYFALNCRELESVVIPEGVTDIGSQAFYGCYKLSDLTIPDTVEELMSFCFADCRSLNTIALPRSLKTMRSGSNFLGCTNLKVVKFKSTHYLEQSVIEQVLLGNNGADAFKGCISITDVYWPGPETEEAKACLAKFAIPSTATVHYNWEVE